MSKLITMKGPSELDPTTMNNFEAALHLLAMLAQHNPNMTWQQFFNMPAPGNRLGDFSDFIGRQYNNAADAVGNFVANVGDSAGSIIRLAADPKVLKAVTTGAAAYSTGGQSLAVQGMFPGDTGQPGSTASNFMDQLGALWKNFSSGGTGTGTNVASVAPTGGISAKTALIGVLGITGLFVLMRLASKR